MKNKILTKHSPWTSLTVSTSAETGEKVLTIESIDGYQILARIEDNEFAVEATAEMVKIVNKKLKKIKKED